MRVGVEVGGTFTDLVAVEGDTVRIAKVPSVPARPDEGALAAIEDAGIKLDSVHDLIHGSTVATNAILERKGAPVAFMVTQGFRDLLLLQRHNRNQIYDLFYKKPEPVANRRDTYEIPERIDADGSVIAALNEAETGTLLEQTLRGKGYGAVAVCLLNAYANPAHEQRVAAMIRERFPDLSVTCSSDVTREFREYERASTTTLAAYVQPVIDAYLARFEKQLGDGGFAGRFSVMQSNGGRLPAEAMSRNAITSLFSGPAAGVIGAVRQAGLSGFSNLITLDMGGTSTDVCLVADGRPDLSTETEVDGLPIRTPVLDIVTVGAGGGSIVWADDGGMLRVGPQSAGADPGPACYGRGGTDPTITDAHLIRGSMRAEAFLGGAMRVDGDAAERAFTDLAARFEMSPKAFSDSAVRVAEANIVGAIQLVSTERGRDPRDYVLVPFGGAGPLHAARVAEELGINTILVPPNAGVLSAFGLLASDYTRYDTQTRKVPLDSGAADQVREQFTAMEMSASQEFERLGLPANPNFSYTLELRYVGQAFEVPVRLDHAQLAALMDEDLQARFAAAHDQIFSFSETGHGRAEIVSFRLGAAAPPETVPVLTGSDTEQDTGQVEIFDRGERLSCDRLTRAAIKADGSATGPALVEDETSTIYIPASWAGVVDENSNLVLRRSS